MRWPWCDAGMASRNSPMERITAANPGQTRAQRDNRTWPTAYPGHHASSARQLSSRIPDYQIRAAGASPVSKRNPAGVTVPPGR